MKKLKTLLQSNYFYIILGVLITIYVLIKTVFISYTSNINSNTLQGTITSITISNEKVTFILKSSEKVRCTYYINKDDNTNYYEYLGYLVEVNGSSKDINNNTIPNTFNYKKYLYNNKIYNNYVIDNIELVKKPNILYKIKSSIYNRANTYNDNIKPYLNLFILGDKSLLSDDNLSNFQSNGIYHLFAVSGMHISLIILVLSFLLKKFKYNKIVISIVLLYFMFLTNFTPSVERVVLFYYLKNIFEYLEMHLDNKKILLLTCYIVIIINPFIIYNTGFLYSFIITLSIMLETKLIKGNYIVKIFKISLISFIVSLPITINMNYEINLLSILLNLFYVPFISLIVFPLTILTFIFRCLSPVLSIIISILEISNNFFNSIKLSIIIPKMSYILIILYYLVLIIIYKKQNNKYLILSFIIIIINILIPKLDSSYYIYFLDVGQGDSAILISPYKNDVTMIDTGGIVNSSFHVSNNTITFLKSLGISKINNLITSHGDYDHMGEAINLVNNFKVEKVIFNCGNYNDLEKELIKVLDKKKIKYYSCIKELNINKNKLYFLQTKEYDNENDNSNVIYTELNGYKFMFMGDASITTEKEIIKKYNLPNIDILKVGHHGSKTSSSKKFINDINPKYSIISVGKNNRYGHPNKEVLENLKNSKIYRTDEDESIMFKIKNNKLKIETCAP